MMIVILLERVKTKLNEIRKRYKKIKKPSLRIFWLVVLVIILVASLISVGVQNAQDARSNTRTQQTLDDVSKQLKQIQENQKKLQDQVDGVGKKISLREERIAQAKVTVLPPVRSVPVPVVSGGVEQWRSLVAKYFPASQVNNALLIMNLESGGNPNALSVTCDRGLMQINCANSGLVNGNLSALYDPETNIRVALELWQSRGWYPWSTARRAGLI